jgi:hypothetical protein
VRNVLCGEGGDKMGSGGADGMVRNGRDLDPAREGLDR